MQDGAWQTASTLFYDLARMVLYHGSSQLSCNSCRWYSMVLCTANSRTPSLPSPCSEAPCTAAILCALVGLVVQVMVVNGQNAGYCVVGLLMSREFHASNRTAALNLL